MNEIKFGKTLVIIGGVAGGMSAAARARRLNDGCKIIVFEKGDYVSFANCGLPYYLGKEINNRDALILQTPASLKSRFNLDVRIAHEVIDIDLESKVVTVCDRQTSNTYTEAYDELIISTGARPIKPDLTGIDLPGIFCLRNIKDSDDIDSWINKIGASNAVIVGGGFIGLEVAEQLVRRGLAVTVVDAQRQVLPPVDPEMAELVHDELGKHGVNLVLDSPVKKFEAPRGAGGQKNEPKSCYVYAGDHKPLKADLVILGIGIKPEVSLALNAGLAIGKRGGILVNEYLQTSAAHVFAVGDAIEVRQPVSNELSLISLGGPANRQGRLVADNIFGKRRAYGGTMGTAIVRVFDLAVASVGLNENQLRSSGIAFEAVHVHPASHAGYYPGASRLSLKIIFHKVTGHLLGAQVAGGEGVDKRIDVLAVAMKAKLTVYDLAELELAYAPPFGAAKDPINLAGMAASDILDGLVEQIDLQASGETGPYMILDVRSASERASGFIPESVHVPLPELRDRLSELPKDKTILVHCQSGQRSYFACRLLSQNGFAVKNVKGGYLTWKAKQATKAVHGPMSLAGSREN